MTQPIDTFSFDFVLKLEAGNSQLRIIKIEDYKFVFEITKKIIVFHSLLIFD